MNFPAAADIKWTVNVQRKESKRKGREKKKERAGERKVEKQQQQIFTSIVAHVKALIEDKAKF